MNLLFTQKSYSMRKKLFLLTLIATVLAVGLNAAPWDSNDRAGTDKNFNYEKAKAQHQAIVDAAKLNAVQFFVAAEDLELYKNKTRTWAGNIPVRSFVFKKFPRKNHYFY